MGARASRTHMRRMTVSSRPKKTQGNRVTTSVRFSQKDFRRGVDDAMTLAPLRDAVRSLAGSVMKSTKGSGGSKPNKSVGVHGRDSTTKSSK